jgi:cytochrome P450
MAALPAPAQGLEGPRLSARRRLRIVEERRAAKHARPDLLDLLLSVHDPETQSADEVMARP